MLWPQEILQSSPASRYKTLSFPPLLLSLAFILRLFLYVIEDCNILYCTLLLCTAFHCHLLHLTVLKPTTIIYTLDMLVCILCHSLESPYHASFVILPTTVHCTLLALLFWNHQGQQLFSCETNCQ